MLNHFLCVNELTAAIAKMIGYSTVCTAVNEVYNVMYGVQATASCTQQYNEQNAAESSPHNFTSCLTTTDIPVYMVLYVVYTDTPIRYQLFKSLRAFPGVLGIGKPIIHLTIYYWKS